MQTKLARSSRPEPGYALVLIISFTAISALIVGSALSWAANNANQTQRNNQYWVTLAAAEAATEKVIARLATDYQSQGESLVYNNLSQYQAFVPTTAENPFWNNFEFNNAQGQVGQTYVARLQPSSYTELQSQYRGLRGTAATYRVVSNARQTGSPYSITGALKQDLQVASIPVFQFAIFYSVELEINPGPAMIVTGRVHSNTNLYTQPNTSLTFQSGVTAVGRIITARHPLDPTPPGSGPVTFLSDHEGGVGSLTLPIGTNNSPDAVYAVLDIPPNGESANSPIGLQRYYNKADMIVLVSNATVTAKSGLFNNFATTIPWQQASNFISTNASFYSDREQKTIRATEINVGALRTWSATNATLRGSLGRDVRAIYVADLRSQTSSTEPGVRLVNGQTLPPLGLTVATPDPLYVKGNYNAPAAYLGTTNTTTTAPASLVGDAITVLSSSWDDSKSTSGLSSRNATSTTINAAFLGGIVPTGTYSGVNQYSGGVENFPRFLEDWNNDTLTYNGSMVVMFYSRKAAGLWRGTGSTFDIYNPPVRNWAFDLNFMDSTKLPPGTPEMRALIRADWAAVTPNKVDYPVFCH